MVKHLKVKLDEESQKKLDTLNVNLERLIEVLSESVRISQEMMDYYQTMIGNMKNGTG